MRWLIYSMLVLLMLGVSVPAEESVTQLEFDEFVAREELMQSQINMWELIHQLEYTQGNQRLRVYAEMAEMQQRIQALVVQILELDLLYHNPDAQ